MFNKVKIASALVAAIATMSTQAAEFDVKVGVVDQGTEEGFVVGASVQAVEGLTVSADYKDFDMASVIEVGVQYEVGVNEFVDLVGGVSYLQLDGDDTSTTVLADPLDPLSGVTTVNDMEDTAISIQAGLKTVLADAVTLEFGMERIDWDESGHSDLAPYLSASVAVSDSVKVSFEHREATDESGIALTWAF